VSVKQRLVLDTECYKDYWLLMFKSIDNHTVRSYELYDGVSLNVGEIRTIMERYTQISFNGNGYDMPMITYALAGASCDMLKKASDAIIVGELRPWEFENQFKVKIPRTWDHIDLIEVAFGQGSLKLYGGRLHSRKLQDLPIEPDASISPEQRADLRTYCLNDLDTTADLYNHLRPQIELREHMTAQYGMDLRSKSDAQIAEAVIRKQCGDILGDVVQRPTIPPGTSFKYTPPPWLTYQMPELQAVLRDVMDATFYVSPTGSVEMPKTLDGRKVGIGGGIYRMGIGGLHSSEQTQAVVSDDEFVLIDRDVTSYYPAIILNCNLAPLHLTRDNAFLRVYRSIVERRVEAKKRGDDVTASVLKITANGSFGKLGSRYSALYSPHLMIQVTITGQLALLMLIEQLEHAGLRVVSGNTDGIVIKCPRARESALLGVVARWEKATGFNTEETRYRAVFSRDVNNYVALKEKGGTKGKGAFASVSISKNPQNQVCVDAVLALLEHGTPVEKTIRACRDIRKFVTVRTVRGGAVQVLQTRYDDTLTPGKKRDALLAAGWHQTNEGPLKTALFTYMTGEPEFDVETAYRMHCGSDKTRYIGKVVRYYVGLNSIGPLHYKTTNKSGGRNKVQSSDGAVPLMELPDQLPADIDYGFYIREAQSILADIGASPAKLNHLIFGEATV
jgi:hypothetical protein